MKKRTVESTIFGSFAVAMFLLLLAGWQMYRSIQEYRETSRLVEHTHKVLEAIEEVRFGINALVGSQRTYIITGEERYLEKNKREEVRIRSVVVRIWQLTADNPRQMMRSSELSELLEERMRLMNNNIELYRSNGFDAARNRIINGTADISMESLDKQCDAMRQEELGLLKQRIGQADQKGNRALVVGALLVLSTLIGLPLMWWRVRRTAQEREASDTLVHESKLLKQISENLTREDKINKAYGDLLTIINQDWFTVEDMTQEALRQFNNHVSIMAGVGYVVQENNLIPISSIGIPLPVSCGELPREVLKRKEIVILRTILADSMHCVSTGIGNVVPAEIIAVPLVVKNEIVAVLELASLQGFSETDYLIIDRIAPQLGSGIKQRKLEQDIKDRSAQLETANFELVTINENSQSLNDALQISNEQLNAQQIKNTESNRLLQVVSKTKSDFLANMSHELRTPLNSVIGFSEVLQDQLFGPLNEKQLEYVSNILISGRHLLALINDILDLSKVESGKMVLDLSTFSLRETLDASLMMLREKALKGGVTLNMDLAPQVDISIMADQRKLKQIMFNLVSNAVKFTPAGGTVEVNAVKDGDFVEISVTDSGMGIKEEDIAKLFHPFTQLESIYTKEYEGTGLGLALNKQLVELHGGRIWVKSEFGSWSRFSFTLPLTQTAGKETPVRQPDVVSSTGNTVLLIEDDPLSLNAMERALHSKGYRALRANDGLKGVEMAQRDRPDLIVLDLMMPGMSGFDVAERLQDEKSSVNVPILVLTSMDLSSADRARLEGKVWRIEGKGSLSTHEFLNLVENAVGSK